MLIAIGLEAAEFDLVRKWSDEGHLPVITELMKAGSWRKLASATEISSGATWASINTGVSPAKHGMGFYHRQLKNKSYRIVKKYADEIGSPLFWERLSEAKLKSAILDIPVIYPVKNFNGVQLIGWGAEGLNFKQSSQPPDLLKNIFSKFGRHPLEGWYQKEVKNLEEWKELQQKLIRGVQLRTSIIKWILEKEPFDFVLAGYAETHWVGHYFWHLTDKSNPKYNPEIAEVCGNAIFEVYKEVDHSLIELRKINPGAAYMIFSNTGMGANYSGQHLIPEILNRIGLGAGQKSGNNKNIVEKILPAKRWGPYAIKKVESIVSADAIEKIKKLVPSKLWDNWTRKFLSIGNNWKHCKVFTVPSDFTGTLRINLKGREPQGIINEGKEYEEVCSAIERAFLELINPGTGKTAVKEVIKVRDRYKGKYIDDLPDIIIKWEGSNPVSSLFSERVGTVTGELPDKRSGAHQTFGFLITSGNNFKQLHELEEKNIMDIAPTILHFFDVPVPEDMDGVILSDMMEQECVTEI